MKTVTEGGKQAGLGGFCPLVCMLKEALPQALKIVMKFVRI